MLQIWLKTVSQEWLKINFINCFESACGEKKLDKEEKISLNLKDFEAVMKPEKSAD